MKKTLLIFALYVLFFTANGQTPLTYTNVIQTTDTNQTKDAIYLKAKEWFVDNFNSSKDVIQLDDKENSTIQGKASIKYYYSEQNDTIVVVLWKTKVNRFYVHDGYVNFTIKLWFKNGKCKYVFDAFLAEGRVDVTVISGTANNTYNTSENYNLKSTDKIYSEINAKVNLLIESLKTKLDEQIDNNW